MQQQRTQPQGYISFADMFDGGGMGRAGDTFEGGLFSGLLNEMGVRPYGYNARHGQQGTDRAPEQSIRPQARPQGVTASSRGPSYASAGNAAVAAPAASPQVAAAIAQAVSPQAARGQHNMQMAEGLMGATAVPQAPPMSGPAGAPSQTAGMKRLSPGLAAMLQSPPAEEVQGYLDSPPAYPNAMGGPAGMSAAPQTAQGLMGADIAATPEPAFNGFQVDPQTLTSDAIRQMTRDQRLALILSGADFSPAQWAALGGM